MPAAHFRFTDEWVCPGTPERVAQILVDLASYPDWWPQVLAVARLSDDSARLLCRASLPYTLDLTLTAVRRQPPLEVRMDGDLTGWVRIDLVPHAHGTTLTWSQEATVTTWRAVPAAALRTLLTWNHARMIGGLRAGLERQVRRPA